MRQITIICSENPRFATGGVQRRVAAEIDYFRRQGVSVTVIAPGSDNGVATIRADREAAGVKYVLLAAPRGPYPLRSVAFSLQAWRYMRSADLSEVIETHNDAGAPMAFTRPRRHTRRGLWVEVVHGVLRDEYDLLCRYASRSLRTRVADFGFLPLSAMEKLAAVRADALVCVSQYGSRQTERWYGIASSRHYIVSNGIDTRLYNPGRRGERADLEGRPLELLFVGRLNARKGIRYLLAALGIEKDASPRLHLTVIGGGPERAELESLACQLGVQDLVTFRGVLDDREVLEAYRSSDIFCFPSVQEGQGIAALEAQACGLPTIASAVGGLAEVVLDQRTGILVPPGDSKALAAAIVELAESAEKRRHLGANAAEWARGFDWSTTLGACHRLYDRLSNDRPDSTLLTRPRAVRHYSEAPAGR